MLAQGALVQTALVAIPSGAAAAPVFINGWYIPLSEPLLKSQQGLRPGQQQFLAAPPPNPTVPFGWYNWLSAPTRFPPRLPTPLQQFLAPSPQPLVPFSWVAALSEPRIKAKLGLRAATQQTLVFHPTPVIDIAWWQPLALPTIRTLPGLCASRQQFLAAPPRLLPTPTITGTLSAIEFKDTLTFGGMVFAAPSQALVGVIEVTFQPTIAIVEFSAPSAIVSTTESALSPSPGPALAPDITAKVSIREV